MLEKDDRNIRRHGGLRRGRFKWSDNKPEKCILNHERPNSYSFVMGACPCGFNIWRRHGNAREF